MKNWTVVNQSTLHWHKPHLKCISWELSRKIRKDKNKQSHQLTYTFRRQWRRSTQPKQQMQALSYILARKISAKHVLVCKDMWIVHSNEFGGFHSFCPSFLITIFVSYVVIKSTTVYIKRNKSTVKTPTYAPGTSVIEILRLINEKSSKWVIELLCAYLICCGAGSW